MAMRYLSVCSGIEAATVAWHPFGWVPVGFSEIDPFPSAVLAHHYPTVPNFGDMKNYEKWEIKEQVDLLVGGTPCQSFSLAGFRGGLSDPRGGLMLTYLEIARSYRPKWIVWENVSGVLSSNGGRDFGTFLGALGDLGYGWAYRVLDAQWVRTHGHPFAVPQRRRRVFVVGCLGNPTSAAKVLFESQSLQRHSNPRRKAGEDPTKDIAKCLAGRRCARLREDGDTYIPVPYDLFKITEPLNKQSRGFGDPCHTLARDNASFAAIVDVPCYGGNDPSCADTVTSKWAKGSGGPSGDECGLFVSVPTAQTTRVRKLTPRECERLQGFPDDYTLIPWRGKSECPDGHRYRALGNSMAVNCMEWIGERIIANNA
jgi:DNA (cytosine-5)-methyltransferase 1